MFIDNCFEKHTRTSINTPSTCLLFALFTLILLNGESLSHAGLITCGSAQREAGLDSAESCITGSGNATAATIDSEYPRPEDWTIVGDVSGANGTNDLLTVEVTSGSWGDGDASGTWEIDSSFWTTYGEAVISMHVGNGGGDPDHWSWLITHGETSGTWYYDKISGGGGGLSNLHLYGVGDPIPEPATMGLAFLALGVTFRIQRSLL